MTTKPATGTSRKKRTTRGAGKTTFAHPTLGFGVPATTDPHHFRVLIPRVTTDPVLISEYLGMQAQDQNAAILDRVWLPRRHWTAIRDEVRRAFNVRLKEHNLQTGKWVVGDNLVDRLLGKELCVLAWAVEGMALDSMPMAVRNWLALKPEERWWLFGMAAVATGGLHDGDRGWRLALRHALGDVAQNEQVMPHRKPKTTVRDRNNPTFKLFHD